jgi:integrase-like protein
MIVRGDQPPRIEMLPRALAGHVMAQVEQPGNLARQGNPAYRLATLILIRCGLRVSDALKLPFDCTATDEAGAPYLRYLNNKMKREALVPVDDELLELIRGQQQRVLDRYPPGAVLFPRPEKNPDGKTPVSSSTYRLALYRWLELCDVCDEHGRPVRLTPHQWRHTLGTVLINRDVPQHVVQKILDHDSPLMTAHYARLSDQIIESGVEREDPLGFLAAGGHDDDRRTGPLAEPPADVHAVGVRHPKVEQHHAGVGAVERFAAGQHIVDPVAACRAAVDRAPHETRPSPDEKPDRLRAAPADGTPSSRRTSRVGRLWDFPRAPHPAITGRARHGGDRLRTPHRSYVPRIIGPLDVLTHLVRPRVAKHKISGRPISAEVT